MLRSDNSNPEFSLVSRPMGQVTIGFFREIAGRYQRQSGIFEFLSRILNRQIRVKPFKYRALNLVYFAFRPLITNETQVFNIREYRYFQLSLKPKYTSSIRNEIILLPGTGTTGEGIHPVGMTGVLNRNRTLSQGRQHLTSREGESLYYERRDPHTSPPAPVTKTVSRSIEDRPAQEHLLPETKGRARTGIKDIGIRATTSTGDTWLTTGDMRICEGIHIHPVGMTGVLNRKRTLSQGLRHPTPREGEHLYYERRDPHISPPVPVTKTVSRSIEDRPAQEHLLQETKGRARTGIKDTTSTGDTRLTTGDMKTDEGIHIHPEVRMTGVLNRKRTLSQGRRHLTSRRGGEPLYYERRDPHTSPPIPVTKTVSRSIEDRPVQEHLLPETKGRTRTGIKDTGIKATSSTGDTRLTTGDTKTDEGIHIHPEVRMTGVLNRKRTLSQGRRHPTPREGEPLYYERRDPHTSPPVPVTKTVSRSIEDRPVQEHLLPETKGRARTGIKDTTSTGDTRLTTGDTKTDEGIHIHPEVRMTGVLNRKREHAMAAAQRRAKPLLKTTQDRPDLSHVPGDLNPKSDTPMVSGKTGFFKPFHINADIRSNPYTPRPSSLDIFFQNQERRLGPGMPGKAPVEMEFAKVDNKVFRQRQINKEEVVTTKEAVAAPSRLESRSPQQGHIDIQDTDVDRIADQVYQRFERKIRIEIERRGMNIW